MVSLNWKNKDFWALLVSGIALVVSIVTFSLSYREQRGQDRLAARKEFWISVEAEQKNFGLSGPKELEVDAKSFGDAVLKFQEIAAGEGFNDKDAVQLKMLNIEAGVIDIDGAKIIYDVQSNSAYLADFENKVDAFAVAAKIPKWGVEKGRLDALSGLNEGPGYLIIREVHEIVSVVGMNRQVANNNHIGMGAGSRGTGACYVFSSDPEILSKLGEVELNVRKYRKNIAIELMRMSL
jgi:hypothetical protein